jgi:hypothetical protein
MISAPLVSHELNLLRNIYFRPNSWLVGVYFQNLLVLGLKFEHKCIPILSPNFNSVRDSIVCCHKAFFILNLKMVDGCFNWWTCQGVWWWKVGEHLNPLHTEILVAANGAHLADFEGFRYVYFETDYLLLKQGMEQKEVYQFSCVHTYRRTDRIPYFFLYFCYFSFSNRTSRRVAHAFVNSFCHLVTSSWAANTPDFIPYSRAFQLSYFTRHTFHIRSE